jgi:hypothetical protein
MAGLDYDLINRAIMRQGGSPLPVPSATQTPLDPATVDALDGAMGVPLGNQALAQAEPIPNAMGQQVAEPIPTAVGEPEIVPAADGAQPIRTIAPDAPVVHRPPELRQPPAAPPAATSPAAPAAPAAPNLGTADGYGIDETMRSLDELTTAQAEAALRTGEAEAKAGERKGAAGNQYAREVEEISKKHATQEAASAEMYQRTMDEFRAMNAAIAAMPAPHDRRNRGERFWGMFATALSDTGAKLVQDGINRDIQLQQNELDNKRKDSNAKLTELGIAREFIQDQRAATQFAAALRKERFAGEMEAAAGELAAGTSRDKAFQIAAQYKVEARQQQLGILKSVMGGKMNALEAAMMVKLGVMSPAEARAAMGVGAGGATEGPAARVPGKLTKGDESKLNVNTYQNELPGVEWLVDPAQVTAADRENVQKIKSAADRVNQVVSRAREAYMVAADPKRSDDERLAALSRYRTLVESQLPGFVSQATGSGTPQEGEAQRLLRSLPPMPIINDVAGVRGALQSLDNWRNDRSMDPQLFEYFVQDFTDVVNSGMSSYKGRLAPPSPQAPAQRSRSSGGSAPKPKQQAAPASRGPIKRLSAEDL